VKFKVLYFTFAAKISKTAAKIAKYFSFEL
jgi:hypothetical protein